MLAQQARPTSVEAKIDDRLQLNSANLQHNPPTATCAVFAIPASWFPRLLWMLVFLFANMPGHAQQTGSLKAELAGTAQSTATAPATTDTDTDTDTDTEAILSRLHYIDGVIAAKLEERRELGQRIELANEQEQADLRVEATVLNDDIQQLHAALEAIATNGADSSLFITSDAGEQGDWREDIALIARPVLDSLKDLTEKPRRIKELNDAIALKERELAAADQALTALITTTQWKVEAARADSSLDESLQNLQKSWQKRHNDASSAIEVARIQIASLRGDKTLSETVYASLSNFVRGRGLTIALAAIAAFTVWSAVRLLLQGYRRLVVNKHKAESRTRYRLAVYSVRALTSMVILIAVFSVFYQRGDVLLLGLLILLLFGLALSVRQLLPRYVKEARLLLNIGAIREGERVLYRNLPWRVESINMFTVFRNPELHGVLRVPLADITSMHSRSISNDSWFPTSKGDVVLTEDNTLLEVMQQNPDTVELRKRGGQVVSVPTADFYATRMTNLTRGGTFGVNMNFGIDYRHQSISSDTVPHTLRKSIRDALNSSDLADYIREVQVELLEAGSSSLDYWIFVTMDSRAAKSYQRIQRITQGACVQTCSHEQWEIPFPHVSIVQKNTGDTTSGVNSRIQSHVVGLSPSR